MLSAIKSYFLLENTQFGGPGGVKRELVLYTGVLVGVVVQWLLEASGRSHYSASALLAGIVASVIIFPTIWEKAGLKSRPVSFVKWCVAFQNGYFWPALFGQIAKQYAGNG